MKLALEKVLAAVILILVGPLLAACILAVRLSSRGPALFRQRRIGLEGKPFDMFKLRSMEVNGDSDTTWSVEHDNRITGVGRFLRRTGLDELPQLLNVLRGEMSLVGPRPERPFFVQLYEVEVPDYVHRHRVRPGITGLAQVHGLRGDTSIPERVYLDNEYIDTWAPWSDVAILFRTVVDMVVRII